jgi:RND family efflux transporter MFP subunit
MSTSSPNLLKRIALPAVAIAVLLVVIAWMAGAFSNKITPGLVEPPQETDTGELLTVSRQPLDLSEPVPAVVGAREATSISSRTLARITRITVRAGDTVAQGQLLIELERSELESRLAQATQNVLAVEARMTEARQSLQRAEQLFERQLVAASALDEARANHDSLRAQLATARQAVREAEVALGYTEIRSPIEGRVVERFAEPGDTASPGKPLLSLYNPQSIRIEAAVRESLALPLELGQELTVEIPALQLQLAATIEELVPAADPGSRSFTVKAQVDHGGRLLPGMYARMSVPAGTANLLAIPADRVAEYGQLNIVWVYESGQLNRRFVRLGREVAPGLIEVVSGLDEGDRLGRPPAP